MDIVFLPHNTHLESPGEFSARDPHLAYLSKMPGTIQDIPTTPLPLALFQLT